MNRKLLFVPFLIVIVLASFFTGYLLGSRITKEVPVLAIIGRADLYDKRLESLNFTVELKEIPYDEFFIVCSKRKSFENIIERESTRIIYRHQIRDIIYFWIWDMGCAICYSP